MRIPEDPTFRPAEINIVPLIDVIFSILVFFIVASLVLTRSEALDVDLPEASTAQAKIQPDVTISITAEGQIAVNQEPVQLVDLIPRVEGILGETEIEGEQKRLVVINADLAITHGGVVEVMDALQQISGHDVSLAIAARRNS